MEKKHCCCSGSVNETKSKKTERLDEQKKKLVTRLSRIEGQVRGVKNMVESDAYCTDILVQVSAIRSALESFSSEILDNHIKECVVRDLKSGKDDVIEELLWTLKKLK